MPLLPSLMTLNEVKYVLFFILLTKIIIVLVLQ